MNSKINGRRYQPICRTVVPSFRSTDALSRGREKKGAETVSSNYPSPRNVSFHGFVSLTYENTLSDSNRSEIYVLAYGIIPRKFIRPRYDLELSPWTYTCSVSAKLILRSIRAIINTPGVFIRDLESHTFCNISSFVINELTRIYCALAVFFVGISGK